MKHSGPGLALVRIRALRLRDSHRRDSSRRFRSSTFARDRHPPKATPLKPKGRERSRRAALPATRREIETGLFSLWSADETRRGFDANVLFVRPPARDERPNGLLRR